MILLCDAQNRKNNKIKSREKITDYERNKQEVPSFHDLFSYSLIIISIKRQRNMGKVHISGNSLLRGMAQTYRAGRHFFKARRKQGLLLWSKTCMIILDDGSKHGKNQLRFLGLNPILLGLSASNPPSHPKTTETVMDLLDSRPCFAAGFWLGRDTPASRAPPVFATSHRALMSPVCGRGPGSLCGRILSTCCKIPCMHSAGAWSLRGDQNVHPFPALP
eukprot:10321_3